MNNTRRLLLYTSPLYVLSYYSYSIAFYATFKIVKNSLITYEDELIFIVLLVLLFVEMAHDRKSHGAHEYGPHE